MTARMTNPAMILDGVMDGVQHLQRAAAGGGVAQGTLELVHLRASQINGCSACVAAGVASARRAGVPDEQLTGVAAWEDATCFDDAQRAALALAEAVTRLADRTDAVPDRVWDAAAAHYDEAGLAALLLTVATTNLFNRLNRPVRQPAGGW